MEIKALAVTSETVLLMSYSMISNSYQITRMLIDMMYNNRNYDCIGMFRCHKETMEQLKEVLNGVPVSRWVRGKVEEEIIRNSKGTLGNEYQQARS